MTKKHSTRGNAASRRPTKAEIRTARKELKKSGFRPAPPPAAVLDGRLEEQRTRIFRVRAICDLAAMAASSANKNQQSSPDFTDNIWSAFELAGRMLNEIADDLDPVRMLRTDPVEAQS